tara:strand:- start:2155 stop:2853 length:699 start_codon:yes stop_codon:yes gene_type:complete
MMTSETMKLSKSTMDVLKNFASINSNILVKPGSTLSTVSPMKNLMGKAKVEETFDVEFGIWDLHKFLGTVSLFSDPHLTFDDGKVVISNESNTSQVVYHYSEPTLLTTPPRDVNMPESVLKFDLSSSELSELMKASSVLQLPDLKITNSDEGEEILLVLTDKGDVTSNTYTVSTVGDNTLSSYSFYFKVDSLKILPGTYTVEVSDQMVSQFTNDVEDITYWIALESDSTSEK